MMQGAARGLTQTAAQATAIKLEPVGTQMATAVGHLRSAEQRLEGLAARVRGPGLQLVESALLGETPAQEMPSLSDLAVLLTASAQRLDAELEALSARI